MNDKVPSSNLGVRAAQLNRWADGLGLRQQANRRKGVVALRSYLVVVLACLSGYTLVVGFNHGWNLLPIFFSNLADMTWSGQFNFDFMTFLGLSGIWVAWRHQFTGSAIALGIVAFFGGMMFLAPYLLWASARAGGDAKILLLGKERASR